MKRKKGFCACLLLGGGRHQAALHSCLVSNRRIMSCRACAGGMLIGVILGSTGWWQYSGQDSPQQVRVASERNRPLALGLTVPPPAIEQNQATVDDAPPTPTVAAAEQIQAAVDETSPTPTVAAADSYWSVGKLRPLTRVVDVAAPGMARYVVQRRSYKKEIIMFTSDHQMIGWAGHWVNQMRKRGYEHWLILGDKESTCHTLQKGWKPMVERFGEEALSCAYSSYPKSHPGWEQWKPKHSVHDDLHYVYVLWASRWWVSWQFLKEGANVLSLDVDAVLLTDIYQLLRAPPLSEQDVILTQNADASKSLNCGFVYFNRDAAGKAPPTNRELGTKARQELKSCAAAHDPNSEAAEADGVPAAEWVARAVWDRIALFLELRRSSLSDSPVREVLWEQDAWNDLAKSLELNRRVFPWAVGYGKDSDLWPLLGYKRTVIGGMLHQEKWVDRMILFWIAADCRWLPLTAPDCLSSSGGSSGRASSSISHFLHGSHLKKSMLDASGGAHFASPFRGWHSALRSTSLRAPTCRCRPAPHSRESPSAWWRRIADRYGGAG